MNKKFGSNNDYYGKYFKKKSQMMLAIRNDLSRKTSSVSKARGKFKNTKIH